MRWVWRVWLWILCINIVKYLTFFSNRCCIKSLLQLFTNNETCLMATISQFFYLIITRNSAILLFCILISYLLSDANCTQNWSILINISLSMMEDMFTGLFYNYFWLQFSNFAERFVFYLYFKLVLKFIVCKNQHAGSRY